MTVQFEEHILEQIVGGGGFAYLTDEKAAQFPAQVLPGGFDQ